MIHKIPLPMIGVHQDGLYNSTFFTNCCGVAICDDEAACPVCKQEVMPGKNVAPHERNRARWDMAYPKSRR